MEVHNGYSLFLDLRDVSQVPMLLQTGWWEPSIDQLLRSVLTPGMSYAIVGAKLGYHACLGAKLIERTGKAFMFEANPGAFALLRRTVAYNGFADRAFLRGAAVVDQPGVRKFHFVREHLGVGTLYEPASSSASSPSLDRDTFDYARQDYTTLHVHAATLDQSVGSRVDRLDVLHLDTGDWEGPAILGGRELIARSPGLQIILKWSVDAETDEARRAQHKVAVDFLVQHKFGVLPHRYPQGQRVQDGAQSDEGGSSRTCSTCIAPTSSPRGIEVNAPGGATQNLCTLAAGRECLDRQEGDLFHLQSVIPIQAWKPQHDVEPVMCDTFERCRHRP